MKFPRLLALLSRPILSGTVIAMVSSVGFAQQQDERVFDDLAEEESGDQTIRRPAPPATGAQSLTSRLSLNGTPLELGERWVYDFDVSGGSRRNTIAGGEVNFIFSSERSQDLDIGETGATFERELSSWVFQLRSADRSRKIKTIREEGGQLVGFNLDLSLTGRCFLPGAPEDGFCTYTPGLATVEGGYDQDTLIPNVFSATTEFGEEISQDVHESLKQPGFNRGEDVPGAALVGLQFDVPNAGFVAGEGLNSVSADRRLDVERRLVPSLARIEQKVSSSSREAAASGTTRGIVFLEPDEWSRKAALLQLSALILPSAQSTVDQTPGTPNISISNNLFFALNNARVPAESFTVFQTGRASVAHSSEPPRSAAETPVATYNGVWFGFSPVREQSITFRQQFIPRGDRTNVSDPVFRQGGNGTPFRDLIDADFLLFDNIDETIESLNFQNIDDLFVQAGLGVSTQDAIRRLTTTETSRFEYVPHLSFNGNRTGGESVLRYYAGAILGDETNAYIGAEYSLQTESGWNAFARADFYSKPDVDYFSEVELRGSRTLNLAPGRQFTFGGGAVVALDELNEERGQDSLFTLDDNRQRADVVARLREGPVDYSLRQRVSKTNGDDWERGTTFSASYSPNDRLFVSAQVTPFSTEETWLQAAAELNWRLNENSGEDSNNQVLQLQVARIKYDLGESATGKDFEVSENTLRVGFQARF